MRTQVPAAIRNIRTSTLLHPSLPQSKPKCLRVFCMFAWKDGTLLCSVVSGCFCITPCSAQTVDIKAAGMWAWHRWARDSAIAAETATGLVQFFFSPKNTCFFFKGTVTYHDNSWIALVRPFIHEYMIVIDSICVYRRTDTHTHIYIYIPYIIITIIIIIVISVNICVYVRRGRRDIIKVYVNHLTTKHHMLGILESRRSPRKMNSVL